MQVEDASFLIVQQEAAKNGRMDLARVMMSAMDDTRRIQVVHIDSLFVAVQPCAAYERRMWVYLCRQDHCCVGA